VPGSAAFIIDIAGAKLRSELASADSILVFAVWRWRAVNDPQSASVSHGQKAQVHGCSIIRQNQTRFWLHTRAVIEHGGYDVLTKPLQEDKVVNVVRLACLYQETGWGQPYRARYIPR
jgi:hypothetical protein